MDQATAERWVTISALTVAGVYAYRRLIEPSGPPTTLKKLAGIGELPPLGAWATAWGFTFLVVSVIAEAAPGVGGAFAIAIMVGDLFANGSSVFADVGKQQGGAGSSKPATAGQVLAATSPTPTGPAASSPLDPLQPPSAFSIPSPANIDPNAPIYIPPSAAAGVTQGGKGIGGF